MQKAGVVVIRLAWIMALLFLSSCVSPQVPKETQPQSPKGNLVLAWGVAHSDWTDYLSEVLETSELPDLVPSDALNFCPRYGVLARTERRDFWAHLLSIMSKYESDFKPETQYQEPEPPQGPGTLSVGLLQLSASDKAYGGRCSGIDAVKLRSPKPNLNCAVTVLSKWVKSDGVIASTSNKGGGRYWSVLRPVQSGKPRSAYVSIQKYVRELSFCH